MATHQEKIFIYGASGHAKVVIDIVEQQGRWSIAFLVDDNPELKGRDFFGYPVVGGRQELLELSTSTLRGIVAIGNNQVRNRVAAWLDEQGFELVFAVHPSARLGRGVQLGRGSVVMAGAVVNSDTRVGRNVIINTCASIDHDCNIGDGVHLAPGSTLCGAVRVGHGSFICAGATVIPNLNIGCNVIVGAGATVIRDVADNLTVVGSPARVV